MKTERSIVYYTPRNTTRCPATDEIRIGMLSQFWLIYGGSDSVAEYWDVLSPRTRRLSEERATTLLGKLSDLHPSLAENRKKL